MKIKNNMLYDNTINNMCAISKIMEKELVTEVAT